MAKTRQKRESEPRRQHGTAATARYDLFVEAYIACNFNGTKAALSINPKMSLNVAANTASGLLKIPYVAERLAQRRKEELEKICASAEETLRIITRSARFDVRKLYHRDGRMKLPHELDDETALALDGLDIDEVVVVKKAGERVAQRSVKYRGSKRMTAADMLMKHHGQYAKDKESGSPDEVAQQVRERLAAMEQATVQPTKERKP